MLVTGCVSIVAVAVLLLIAGQRVAGLLLSSALVVLPAALAALVIGATIAALMAKSEVPGRGMACGILAGLVLLPLHVVVTGWMSALGDWGWAAAWLAGDGPARGWLVGYSGAIFLHAIAAAPAAALLSLAAFRGVDSRREQQSLLETSPPTVLARVTLPEVLPSLTAIGVVLAVMMAAEITVTDLLLVRTFAEEVYTQAAAGQLFEGALADDGARGLLAGTLALAVLGTGAVVALSRSLKQSDETSSTSPWVVSGRWWQAIALHTLIGILIGVPIVSLMHQVGTVSRVAEDGEAVRSWSASKAIQTTASAPWQHRRELSVSVALAACVATGATPLAALLAWGMRRRGWRAQAILGLLTIGLAIPGPLIGVAVIRALNQPIDSPLGWLGDLYGTWFAPWLAQQFRIVPVLALVMWPAMRTVGVDVLDAAKSDGAGLVSRLVRIVVPLSATTLAAAWLVAFALSIGELSATILVVPPGTPPLAVRLLSLLHYGVEDRVAAISLVLVAGAALIVAALSRLLPVGRWLG